MEDWATNSDRYDAQHRGETRYDDPEATERRTQNNIALWIRWNSTPMLRDLIGSLAAELRLRMHTDAANYLAKAAACLEETR